MMRLSPTLRIAIGLACLGVSVFLASRVIGLGQDEWIVRANGRAALCEMLALHTTSQLQHNAGDALPSLLPVGLADQSGLFNKVYRDAFQQIVLRNADIKRILDRQAQSLERIIQKTGAPCWAPDEPSNGPCPVN